MLRAFTIFFLFTLFNNSWSQQYGPNQYQIHNFHDQWYTFYSTTVVGASTLNHDTTGVLVLCKIHVNNCILRIDVNGKCLWNGVQKVRISIDGKKYGVENFTCSGAPVGTTTIPLNLSMLIAKMNNRLNAGMKKGTRVNFDFYDATNSPIGMQASLMGFTAAINEMNDMKNQLR